MDADILDNEAAYYLLKQALEGALQRDPVDAANDAEVLAGLMAERANNDFGPGNRQIGRHRRNL